MATLIDALEDAFLYFGSVPQELLFDQMKAVITRDLRLEGGALRFVGRCRPPFRLERFMRPMFWATIIASVLHLATPVAAATVDGIPIHSSTTGTGRATLLFVHGWTCDETSWVGQVPAFANQYRVITVDLPGHGRSGSPKDGQLSMDLFARAVEAVRAEARADKVVLIGHSMGGGVIRHYARLYPQRVAGIVTVDAPLRMEDFPVRSESQFPPMTGPEGIKAREQIARGMFVAQTPPALQERIIKMMLSTPESTAVAAMRAVMEGVRDPAQRGGVLNVPAFTVYAGTATLPNLQEVRKVVPDYAQVQLEGTGHFLMMEKPAEFNRLLTGFLSKIRF